MSLRSSRAKSRAQQGTSRLAQSRADSNEGCSDEPGPV